MKVKIEQFLFGKNHSWAVTGKELGRALIKRGHDISFVSTDGMIEKFIPNDLKPFLKKQDKYDCQISYTYPHNFPNYLKAGPNRFGIWNYEFNHLPEGASKYIYGINKFCPSSKFFYDICINKNIDANKMKIIPHGVDWDKFNVEPLKLKTEKKVKFLINFGQPHLRKNIDGTLDIYGKAFNKKDDVCLVIKGVNKKVEHDFEVNFDNIIKEFRKKYPNHGEILILNEYIPSIESLYKACDCLFMLTRAEAFFLPALEMLAAGGLVITSRYGGQLDFLNDDNSILVNGDVVRADGKSQYWKSSVYSGWFEPNEEDAISKIKDVYFNLNKIKSEKLSDLSKLKEYYSWNNSAKMFEDLCE